MENKISIIIPVYNEENLVKQALLPVLALALNKEVIVVNDGSTDNTLAILQELEKNYDFVLVNQPKNQGKGAAILKGLSILSGSSFIIYDADLEYKASDIERLYQELAKHKSEDKVAIYGSRFLHNKKISFHYLVNTFLTRLTNLLFLSKLTDMETCFKLVPTKALSEITLSGGRFEFEPELTAQLLKAGYKITEIPIDYERRSYEEGKKITAKDGFIAVKTILKEYFNK